VVAYLPDENIFNLDLNQIAFVFFNQRHLLSPAMSVTDALKLKANCQLVFSLDLDIREYNMQKQMPWKKY